MMQGCQDEGNKLMMCKPKNMLIVFYYSPDTESRKMACTWKRLGNGTGIPVGKTATTKP